MKMCRLTEKALQEDPIIQLTNFKKSKEFLVTIDTDGCVTDNMNGKQMLIFHPMYMEFYGLWGMESYFREVAEYFNLFSVHRGANRFIAIQLTLHALNSREDVDKNILVPRVKPLDEFIDYTKEKNMGLGNPLLKKFIDSVRPKDFYFYKLFAWSDAVNSAFPYISANIPPFEGVQTALEHMDEYADIVVVSQTPYNDLANYWEAHKIDEHISCILAQEQGTKAENIRKLKAYGNYSDDRVLMIGDAAGDLKAAKANNVLFYPIIPGKEKSSWATFSQAFERLVKLEYTKDFENTLLDEFDSSLPKSPDWESTNYNHVASYIKRQEIRKSLYQQFNPEGRLLIL